MWLCYYWQCSEFLCFSTPVCASWRWLYFHCVPLSDGVRKSVSFSYVNVDCSTVWASLLHILYRKTAHRLSKVVWAKVLKQQKLKCLLHTCSGHQWQDGWLYAEKASYDYLRSEPLWWRFLCLFCYLYSGWSIVWKTWKCRGVGDFELTAVTEMSGILLQVSEVTGRKSCQGKEVMNKIDGVNVIICLFLK